MHTTVNGNIGKCVVWGTVVTWLFAGPAPSQAQGPIQLQRFEGKIAVVLGGVVPFDLHGEAAVLGKFTSKGEIVFVPGSTPSTLTGQGVVVCKTEAGDMLVGITRWNVSAVMGEYRLVDMQFSWRGSIRLSDGAVVSSTGRFAHEQPGDMTARGIIAILIGLLVPAV